MLHTKKKSEILTCGLVSAWVSVHLNTYHTLSVVYALRRFTTTMERQLLYQYIAQYSAEDYS